MVVRSPPRAFSLNPSSLGVKVTLLLAGRQSYTSVVYQVLVA